MKKLTTIDLTDTKPSLQEFAKTPRQPIFVVLDNIRSLQNVGLFFRLSDALRIEKLYLGGYTGFPPQGESDPRMPGTVEHAEREIEKTAIKTIPYVPWEKAEDTIKLIKDLKQKGVQIVAIEQTDNSVPYTTVDYHFPVALVFGHERDGVSDEVLELCDKIVEIPMYGMGNSLNVATSFAVVGYELVKLTEKK